MPIRELAMAKVNLFLRVTGRRPDGYHLLESLAVFGPGFDVVEAEASDGLSLAIEGRFGAVLAVEPDNLVLRAARALAAHAGVAPHTALRLTKNLPVASGIGGGSADAAAALRALCRLWGIEPSAPELAAIALGLGADVPVCLASRPVMMRGIGEVLGEAPALPGFGLLLVNPLQAVATPAVFKARAPGFSPPAALPGSWQDAAGLAADLRGWGNDLQAPALGLCPVIGEVLAALRASPGCLLAQMSGSGATCFGLYGSAAEAEAAARLLPAGWWHSAGAVAAA